MNSISHAWRILSFTSYKTFQASSDLSGCCAPCYSLGRSGLFQHLLLHLLLLSCICGLLLPPCGYVQLLQLCISGIALTPVAMCGYRSVSPHCGYVWLLQLGCPDPLCLCGYYSSVALTPCGCVWLLQLQILYILKFITYLFHLWSQVAHTVIFFST